MTQPLAGAVRSTLVRILAGCFTDSLSCGVRALRTGALEPGHIHYFDFCALVWCAWLRGGGRDARGVLSKESGVQVWQNDLPWSAATSVICRQTALLHGIQGAPLRLYFASHAVPIQGPRSTACIGIVGGARAGCGVAGVTRTAPEWACIRETAEPELYQHDNRKKPGGAILCAHGGSKRARCGYWEVLPRTTIRVSGKDECPASRRCPLAIFMRLD